MRFVLPFALFGIATTAYAQGMQPHMTLDQQVAGARQIVVGTIAEIGHQQVIKDNDTYGYEYVIVRVEKFLKGIGSDVLPGYRESFPVIFPASHYVGKSGMHGDMPAPPGYELTQEKVGAQFVFMLLLPTKTANESSDWGVPKLQKRFGRYDVALFGFVPISDQEKVRQRLQGSPPQP
jgi:hypothetical protein